MTPEPLRRRHRISLSPAKLKADAMAKASGACPSVEPELRSYAQLELNEPTNFAEEP